MVIGMGALAGLLPVITVIQGDRTMGDHLFA